MAMDHHSQVLQGRVKREMVAALKRMQTNKATGPDEIPMDAWRALGKTMNLLWIFLYKIEVQGQMSGGRA